MKNRRLAIVCLLSMILVFIAGVFLHPQETQEFQEVKKEIGKKHYSVYPLSKEELYSLFIESFEPELDEDYGECILNCLEKNADTPEELDDPYLNSRCKNFCLNHSFYEWLGPPETPSQGECKLEIGKEITLTGKVEHLREKTSKGGNKYYLFDIVTDSGCRYPAFSFNKPIGSRFTGVWDFNRFGNLQFTVKDFPSPGEELER